MLVLARRPQETILIGEGASRVTIAVTRIDCDREQVHIGIDAPRDVLILRGELCEQEESDAPTT